MFQFHGALRSTDSLVIDIVIDGKPVPKERPRLIGNKSVYTPPKTKAFEELVGYTALSAMHGRKPLEGPIAVSMVFCLPISKSWSLKKKEAARQMIERPTTGADWDNLVKAICDGFNGIVWKDDAQVVEGHVFKIYSDKPKTIVSIDSKPTLKELIKALRG